MYRGMGAASSQGQQILSGAAAGGASLTSILVGAGAVTGPVGAIIAGGIALASLAIEAIMNSGCGQTCIQSTQFANQAEAALQQNIAAYFALPAPRSQSNQAAALANFDKFWAWLQQQCAPIPGRAGQACISDRQAGSCKWTQPADKVPAWGTPSAGQCWNWFSGYRDPIANDPNVVPDEQVAAASSDITGAIAGIPSEYLLLGAAAALLLAVAL